jgi:hypothetical protein
MKKIALLIFILFACNYIEPEPADFTLEKVSVEGGQFHRVQDSVSLLIVTRGLPPSNKWEMIWEVNGQELFSEDVSGKSGSFSSIKKYKGSQTGEYLFKGCIASKNLRVCNEKTFFLR